MVFWGNFLDRAGLAAIRTTTEFRIHNPGVTGENRSRIRFSPLEMYLAPRKNTIEYRQGKPEALNRLIKLNMKEYSNSIYPEFSLKKLVCQTNARNYFPIS
jgi:hypothetical protein